MDCSHLTFSSDGRLPLFPDETARRAALHCLARTAGQEIALFCMVDDHLHLVLLAPRARVGRLAQAFAVSLGSVAATKLDPARIRPVETRAHLQWLVRYVLTQPQHHGLPTAPALWSGSCFQDLVGARQVPGLTLRITDALPRLTRRELHKLVELPPAKLKPATDEAVRTAGAARLVAAAGASLAVGPTLEGNKPTVVQARRAAAQLAAAAQIPATEVAWALGSTPRATRRLTEPPVPAATIKALRLRLTLEDRLHDS